MKLSIALAALVLLLNVVAPTASALAQPNPCGSDPHCVYVPYICNYDVLCDAAGRVIPGPPDGRGVRLGNGQICAMNGCTRP